MSQVSLHVYKCMFFNLKNTSFIQSCCDNKMSLPVLVFICYGATPFSWCDDYLHIAHQTISPVTNEYKFQETNPG